MTLAMLSTMQCSECLREKCFCTSTPDQGMPFQCPGNGQEMVCHEQTTMSIKTILQIASCTPINSNTIASLFVLLEKIYPISFHTVTFSIFPLQFSSARLKSLYSCLVSKDFGHFDPLQSTIIKPNTNELMLS